MDNEKQAELEKTYGAVIDLALAASDAYSAMAKAKRENKPTAGLSETNDAAADKLRATVASWTPDQAKECASHMQHVGFADAMRGEEGKRQWEQEISRRYSRGLVALKMAFVLKTKAKSQDDDRVNIVNARIRGMLAFIPAAAAMHYRPERGFNAFTVRDVLARLDKEIKFRSGSDARAVRLSADSYRKLYQDLKESVSPTWLEAKPQSQRNPTLGETLPEEGIRALKASVASAASAVPPANPAGKREGGRKQRR